MSCSQENLNNDPYRQQYSIFENYHCQQSRNSIQNRIQVKRRANEIQQDYSSEEFPYNIEEDLDENIYSNQIADFDIIYDFKQNSNTSIFRQQINQQIPKASENLIDPLNHTRKKRVNQLPVQILEQSQHIKINCSNIGTEVIKQEIGRNQAENDEIREQYINNIISNANFMNATKSTDIGLTNTRAILKLPLQLQNLSLSQENQITKNQRLQAKMSCQIELSSELEISEEQSQSEQNVVAVFRQEAIESMILILLHNKNQNIHTLLMAVNLLDQLLLDVGIYSMILDDLEIIMEIAKCCLVISSKYWDVSYLNYKQVSICNLYQRFSIDDYLALEKKLLLCIQFKISHIDIYQQAIQYLQTIDDFNIENQVINENLMKDMRDKLRQFSISYYINKEQFCLIE
ncbi:UNKNOWN [Stylonychia lemnae]|uniref:Uncharacterized protein n=1 Tax=Stylonychia lemnae TaxID=5949 RepID=A0A077ZUP2_STYLE|nr:UNKNOWN [Stylonychia lemnae]|eukprot:CDW73264.1 UNKNOWN [Stylonychia lemnae]